jgi:crotonobetainyl-CoA:carnitine CoA-transferase CaiB-like acyl-CoA transferase
LLVDERLMAPAERFDRAEEIDRAVQPWFSARRADEAVEALQAARVPAGRAQTFLEVLAAEQLAVRHFWAHAPWLSADAMMPAAPFRVGDVDAPSRRAPAPGGDTAAVLAEAAASERNPFPRIDLHELKAIETTVGWAGPLTARFLADLGVDVIKVEHPAGRGVGPAPPADPAWMWGTLPHPQLRAPVFPNAEPGARWWNRMGVWNKINRNKRDVGLDLKADEGRDVLARLVERCDIIIHNYTPRAAASMGLDAAGVARHNARAVTVLMSGYGGTGPLASHASWGPILEAYAGFDEATGYADGGPMRLGLAFPDAGGGLHGAFAALAGVWERERTNASVHVDLSQLETLVSLAGESLLFSSVTGSAPVRMGNRSVQYAPQGCYRCAGDDAWVVITVRSDDEWAALVGLFDVAALAEFRGVAVGERAARHDEIDAAISWWTATRSPLDVAMALQGVGVPACPAFTNGDLVENEHIAARGFMASWDQPDVGSQTFPGFPIHFERTPVPMRPAPPLGADNVDVLTWLGYDAATIERLQKQRVIADEPPTAG